MGKCRCPERARRGHLAGSETIFTRAAVRPETGDVVNIMTTPADEVQAPNALGKDIDRRKNSLERSPHPVEDDDVKHRSPDREL